MPNTGRPDDTASAIGSNSPLVVNSFDIVVDSPPGGESLVEVAERVVAGLNEINEQHRPDEQVLVVGHGVALAVALGTFLDGDPGRWRDYPVANCSLTELVLSPSPYVNFFNSTTHL